MEIGELLSQCAESKVFDCSFYGHRAVMKHRFPKTYRHPDLDTKLREQRTAREARALARCRKFNVTAPTVYSVDRQAGIIVMERIDGISVRDFLSGSISSALVRHTLESIGQLVGTMHEADIIHGDLTTSNFILREVDSVRDLVVIDFGLVKESGSAEERAVDLYVLERAIMSAHPLLENVEAAVLAGYMRTIEAGKGKQTVDRLMAVRARGRKRSMVG
jgi:TP53 regulating kinase-like protein